MRHFALRPLLAAAVLTAAAAAQMQEPPSHVEPVNLQSGLHDNPSPVEGLVWSDFVILPQGTPWLRLRFLGAHLGKGSWLRITSVLDGAFMTMREEHLAQWGNTSAYFNGNAVMIELFAGANTVGNHVDVLQAIAGDVDPSVLEPDTICGQTDDRVPSSDPRVGRLSMGCTGWLINVPAAGTNKLHLAAGHCVASNPVLSFAVPSSGANCALAYPPPSKQFAIDTTTMQSSNGGVGNDWWVYRCFPNSTTGRTSFEEQGAAFTLAAALPATGTTLRNYGYGLDGTNVNNATGANGSCSCSSAAGTGTRNQTQQMHTGLLNAISGTSLRYDFDTCGGNSGSVVLHGTTDQVLGIHTHGGCSTTAGTNNIGTAITLPALQTAIAAVAPPAVANDVCAAPTQLALGTNGPFDSVAATSDALAWPCGGTGPGKDLWFRFTSVCGGLHTISTCTPARSFDTVLQVFSGSCGALTSLGCNDDAGGACGTGSTLAVNLPAGSYLLRVGGFAAASGTFELVVTRPEIHDAGPLVTHPTGGAGGAPASLVETAAPVAHAILGYAASSPSGVADDFVTNGPWCLQGLEIPVYQLGAAAPTITGVFVEVYGGDPRLGAPPVAGSPGIANNLLTTAGHRVAVRMSGALRALDTTPLDATRRLQSVHVDFAAPMYLNSTVLPGSRYYVQARFTGSAAGSVFVPPITAIGLAATGDGLQWNGAAWSSLLDNGAGQGVPIQLFGTSLAPAAEIADLGGGCAASTLAVTGALHAGGFVHARLQNTTLTALPAILLGLSDPAIAYAPACGCVQHAAIDVLHLGASYTIQAPATTAALGFQVYLQGAELAPAAQPCNLGLGFLFGLSNGVRVRLH